MYVRVFETQKCVRINNSAVSFKMCLFEQKKVNDFLRVFEARKKYDQLNKGHNGIRPLLDRMRKKNEIEYM